MEIKSTKRFDKMYKKAPVKIQHAFLERLRLFEQNKFHSLLDNHILSGNLKGYRSINISGDWRAVFRELEGGKIIFFILIGTHSQLYE